MSNFKQHLEEEKAQLDEKIGKLNTFQKSENFANVDPEQQSLLNIQAQAMHTYSQVLTERLTWLNKPKPEDAQVEPVKTGEMQQTISSAKGKGFITIEEESTEYNYKMALEFLNLNPSQQRELASISRKVE